MEKHESYVKLDTNEYKTYISWYVPENLRGHGVATRLARELLADNPIRPIFAIIRPWNAASRRVAEKLGFIVYAFDNENVTYILEW